jgi:lipopolysaccharide export system protein LptC
MNEIFNRIAIGLGLLALAVLSWWLPLRLTQPGPTPDNEEQHEPDYVVENFTAIEMDAIGWRKNELRAARLEHFPDDDTTTLKRPYLIQYQPDGPPTHTRADRGTIEPNGKVVMMYGNVRVSRGSAGKQPGGEVVTQQMRVILE